MECGGGNSSVLPSSPHGEVPRYSPAKYLRGRSDKRRFVDLLVVLSEDPEVGVMPGRRMSGKGKHPRETAGALNVLTLKGGGGDCTRGTGTATKM